MRVQKTIPKGTYLCDGCSQPAPFVGIINGGDYCKIDGCTEGGYERCLPRRELPKGFLPYTNDYLERWGRARNCIKHLIPVTDCRDCREGP